MTEITTSHQTTCICPTCTVIGLIKGTVRGCPGCGTPKYSAEGLSQHLMACAAYNDLITDEQETCDYCGQPITDDNPGEPCSGADGPLHTDCHNETGCRRVE